MTSRVARKAANAQEVDGISTGEDMIGAYGWWRRWQLRMTMAFALVVSSEARAVQVGAVAPRQLRAAARADSAAPDIPRLWQASEPRQGRNRSFIIPALETF